MAEHCAGAAQFVTGAKNDAANAVQQQRTHAHHARLEGRIASHLVAVRPVRNRHTLQGLDFSVPAGVIARKEYRIAGLGDHFVTQRNNGADRQIADALGFEREHNGALEPLDIIRCYLESGWHQQRCSGIKLFKRFSINVKLRAECFAVDNFNAAQQLGAIFRNQAGVSRLKYFARRHDHVCNQQARYQSDGNQNHAECGGHAGHDILFDEFR
jgi:hypothetical protein